MFKLSELPSSLCALILVLSPVLAQSSTTPLSLNVPHSISRSNASSSSPLLFSLPSSQNQLSVSVALCRSTSSNLQFFVSNSSSIKTPGPGGGQDVFQFTLSDDGFGSWTGLVAQDGAGTLAVYNVGPSDSLQVGVSDSSPLFDYITSDDHDDGLPLFGDSTSNQAILFSPVFANVTSNDPTYPNYTLPDPSQPFFSVPSPPATSPHYTLLLSPTSSSSSSMLRTACALTAATDPRSNGTLASASPWLRDLSGWRTEWFVEGLTPHTNYTAFAIRDGTAVAGPIYFTTKSGLFACPLVRDLPYCPSIAHAVPLAVPSSSSASFYTADTLPSNISDALTGALANFSTALTTFACGRDLYSPLQSCADCRRAYQKWLCAVSFPRCAEFPDGSTSSTSATATMTGVVGNPTPALVQIAASATPRNPSFPPFALSYAQLLPCYETCTAADRACPNFLGFKCPVPRFNANESYGVGYVDGGGDIPGMGVPGVAQDRWGTVWCDPS